MIFKNMKEIEKWCRGSTLKEIKDYLINGIQKARTKDEVTTYLILSGEIMKRRSLI